MMNITVGLKAEGAYMCCAEARMANSRHAKTAAKLFFMVAFYMPEDREKFIGGQ